MLARDIHIGDKLYFAKGATPILTPSAAEPGSVLALKQQGIPQHGSFFGREREVAELSNALRSDITPLIVLVGMGGMGKTALALEVANKLENDIFDTVVWATSKDYPLTLDSLLDIIARVLHFPYLMQLDVDRKEQEIKAALAGKKCLLLVDNFETISDGEVPRFLKAPPAPTKILITSRTIVLGEYAKVVELKGLNRQTAGLLLNDAAERVNLDLEEIKPEKLKKLHELTAGAPQAIEWVVSLAKEIASIDHVLYQLETASGSLFEGMFGQFWQLLNEEEKIALESLPVFAAPVSHAALQAVSFIPKDIYYKAIRRLRQLNLLHADESNLDDEYRPRFYLHPLSRAFSSERLRRTPGLEDSLRERLAKYYLSFAKIFGGDVEQEDWDQFDHLEEERVNIFAALDWCYVKCHKDLFIPLLQQVSRYLFVYGHWQRRVQYCWQAIELLTGVKELEQLSKQNPLPLDLVVNHTVASLLRDIGRVYTNQDKYTASHKVLTTALTLAEATGNLPEIAFVHFHLGELSFRQGDLSVADKHWQESLRLNNQLNRIHHIIGVTYWLGVLAYKRGNLDEAWLILNENLQQCQAQNWERLEAYHLNYLGEIALQQKQYDLARNSFNRAYAIVKRRDTRRRALLELSLARLDESTNNPQSALSWAEEALRHFTFLSMEKEEQQARALVEHLKKTMGQISNGTDDTFSSVTAR